MLDQQIGNGRTICKGEKDNNGCVGILVYHTNEEEPRHNDFDDQIALNVENVNSSQPLVQDF